MKLYANSIPFQSHPYHLVQTSPWPLAMSFALLLSAISLVLLMQGYLGNYSTYLLSLGLLLTVTGMALWFRDVITESTYLGDHTSQVKRGITIGIGLFIVSELMAFISIFWAYFHSSLSPAVEIGQTWPPIGITALDPFAIPLLNTVLLLSSGATVTYAHHSIINGNRLSSINGLLLTIVLAILFTALQYYEYAEAGFSIADSVFGTTFFCSTGLHGLHVIVGTLFLGVQFKRLLSHHITTNHHVGLEGAIAYWHFVDVVWLGLYASVYLWAANP